MGRKTKYTKETKLKEIKNYLCGRKTVKQISIDLNCHESSVRRWICIYNSNNIHLFDDKPKNNSYSKEFKEKVIHEYLNGIGSYQYIALKNNIPSESIVKNWVTRYNSGIENKKYNPNSEVYTMKARKTTFEERVEIVEHCNSNGLDYKLSAEKYNLPYSLIYAWTNKYLKFGKESLQYMKKGPNKDKKQFALSENEKMKQEIERLRFENEVLKKKQYFEEQIYLRELSKRQNTKR